MTASATIKKPRKVFAIFGLPKNVVERIKQDKTTIDAQFSAFQYITSLACSEQTVGIVNYFKNLLFMKLKC